MYLSFCIESYHFDNESNQTVFSHPMYGEITANIIELNNTVFAYSVTVVFSNASSSNSCAVLFTDHYRYLIATTKFIDRYVCSFAHM